MNIRQLEVFKAVMEAGSATGAARRLSLSQPAVSQHVSQLEAALGLTLFVREYGRLKATEHAIALHGEVVHAFDSLDRVFNFARTIRGNLNGLVRIGCPHSLAEGLMPRVARRFHASYPRVRISLDQGRYAAVIGMVAAREVDFGIAKGDISHPGVTTRALASTKTVCALPAGHRLETSNRLTVRDLASEPLIMLGQSRPWRYEIEILFRKRGLVPRVQIETHSVSTACNFVAQGMGLALVPYLLAKQFLHLDIVLLPVDFEVEHNFCTVIPSLLTPSPLTEQFLCELKKEVEAENR